MLLRLAVSSYMTSDRCTGAHKRQSEIEPHASTLHQHCTTRGKLCRWPPESSCRALATHKGRLQPLHAPPHQRHHGCLPKVTATTTSTAPSLPRAPPPYWQNKHSPQHLLLKGTHPGSSHRPSNTAPYLHDWRFLVELVELWALVMQGCLAGCLHRVHPRKRGAILEQLVRNHAEGVHIHLEVVGLVPAAQVKKA